jgi:hypothetical protein
VILLLAVFEYGFWMSRPRVKVWEVTVFDVDVGLHGDVIVILSFGDDRRVFLLGDLGPETIQPGRTYRLRYRTALGRLPRLLSVEELEEEAG